MTDQIFSINTFILRSNNDDYYENKIKKIIVKKKIGEGSYGLVFLLNNNHVIKIFKNSTLKNTILNESSFLLPIKNENRELIFYYKYINNKKENNFIINLYAIGLIKDTIIDKSENYETNSYFIILPYCISFYNNFNIYNSALLHKNNGLNFTLNVMKRLVQISEFLETNYNIINIDFKLNNFMFSEKSKNLNNLIMIDFSIIKNKSKKKYNIENKYYIWPYNENVSLEYIPPYSICINGLELLFGHDEVIQLPNKNKMNYFLKNIQNKNSYAHTIFYNGIVKKINSINFLKLFESNYQAYLS
jgi:hypothetical protein